VKRTLAALAAAALLGVAGLGHTLIGVVGNFYPYPEEPYSLFMPGFAVGYDAGPLVALFSVTSALEEDGCYWVPVTLSVLPTWPLPGSARGFVGIDLSGAFAYCEEDAGFAFVVGPTWGIRLGLDWEFDIGASWLHVDASWILPRMFQLGVLYEFGPIGSE